MRFKVGFTIINHLMGLFMIFLSLSTVVTLFLFCFFEMDVTANGKGTIKCSDWIDITSEIQGIIREMRVTEGEWVKEGECLFLLEDRERKVAVEATQLKISELKLQSDKLRSRMSLTEKDISGAIHEVSAVLAGAKATYRIAVKGPKPEEIRLAKEKIRRAEKNLDKGKKDYELMQTGFSLKLVSKLQLENSFHEIVLSEIDLRVAQNELDLLRNKYDADQRIAAKAEVNRCEAMMNKALARGGELEILRKELEAVAKAMTQEKKKLVLLKQQLYLTKFASPLNGYVLTHDTEHLVGQAVQEGSVVLRIGNNREYIIDCKISERDFPLVEVAQKSRVQIKPFPRGEYKLFEAEVIQVGADIAESGLPDEFGMADKLSAFMGGGASLNEGYYPVILRLEKPYSMSLFGKKYEIKPGFSAEVEIITHKERIATFLLRRVLRIKGKLTSDKIHF